MNFRLKKTIGWTTAAIGLLAIGLLAAIHWVLPPYVETRIIPRLAEILGLEPESVGVRRVGLWGADIGPIRFNGKGSPVISIAAIQVDYTPVSLIKGKIAGITLGGPHLNLAVTPQGIAMPTAVRPAGEPPGTQTDTPLDFKNLMPVDISRIRIDQGTVTIQFGDRRLAIALDMQMDTAKLSQGQIKGRAQLSVLGNPIALEVAVDQSDNRVSVSLDSTGLLLESLALSGMIPLPVQMAGTAKVHGKGQMTMTPFRIQDLALTASLENVRIGVWDARIENIATAENATPRIELTLQRQTTGQFRWSLAPFRFTSAARGEILGLAGLWDPSPSGWSLNADIQARLPAQMVQGAELKNDLPINGQIQAQGSADGAITFTAGASGSRQLSLQIQPAGVEATDCRMVVEGRLAGGVLETHATWSAGKIRIAGPAIQASMPDLMVKSAATFQPPGSKTASRIDAQAVLSDIRSKLGTILLTIPRFGVNASGQNGPGRPWHFQGRLDATGAMVQNLDQKLALSEISLNMPLAWPPPANGKNGRLNVKSVQWNQRQLGRIHGTLQQRANGMGIDLRHDSKLFPEMVVLIHGGMNDSGLQLDARIPADALIGEMDLGRFFPEAAGILVKGRMSASIQATISGGQPSGSGQLWVDQASVRQEERKLRLNGIHLDMHMDDLTTLKSAPMQKLQIAALQFGNLAAQALDMDFQLERGKTLFIEKAGINWCNGRINTAAIRITPGNEDYDVTLFCDRLNLAMVLDQLGAAEASGEGTVNGRIPVRWANGKLSFDNGFLYSTPGQAGAIQLSGTEMLLSGMPPGTPQHTQLDIATEALKDYTYQWAKLNVSSDADNLLLALKFDGKPNRLLPFAYDQSLGQFKRVAGKGQADFKGISIDLNFTSPLNDIIHYKELFRQN